MKFLKGDVIINEWGQQFYVVNDVGDLRLVTNAADGLEKEFRLVANTYPEMTGKVKPPTDEFVIDLTAFTSEVEDDMFLKDIVNEEIINNRSFKYNSVEFMSKTGMLMHNAHGSI